MDSEDVDNGRADEAVHDEGGISRRTMIRRGAIAGGAVLWATPVVQSLGNNDAFGWFRGSDDPGGCLCSEKVESILPVSCVADRAGPNRLSPSGKTVTFQVTVNGTCGTRLHCEPFKETHLWTQVSANGCSLVGQAGDTASVHVASYPASITLHVVSTLECVGGPRGRHKSCSGDKTQKFCFSQVTGYGSERCGRYPPHVNTKHGTERCH